MVGLSVVIVFGIGACLNLAYLIRPPIMLLFGPDGVAMPTGLRRRHAPLIPWSAVKAIRIYRLEAAPLGSGIRMLGLVPADDSDTVWAGRGSRWNRRLSGVPVSVSGQLVAGELEELVDRFRLYKEELPVEYGEPRAVGFGWLGRP